MDWQTIIAVGIVILTLVFFVMRLVRPKHKRGCDHCCGCKSPSKK